MEDEGYVMTDLSFSAPLIAIQSLIKLKPHRALSKTRMLMLMIKIKDNLGGGITKSGGVRKTLSQTDKQKLINGYKRAKKILENARAEQIYCGGEVAAHPVGTVKIGEIVNSNLRTIHDNLYVCDCSVIPEAWGLPPTLTLLGLGKRLAKHLSA
ncbi:MAG: GMC oxidoreductase [Pseudomonadota bacterium]